MKKNSNNSNERKRGISFWQPTSDLMTVLVLVLLLIILLLMLYLIRLPDSEILNNWLADGEETTDEDLGEGDFTQWGDEKGDEDEDVEEDGHHEDYVYVSGGGGDDGDGDGDGTSDGGDYDDVMKSAVEVYLIDGDTGKRILQEGVEFRLNDYLDRTVVLNTYYPERISYQKYETTEDGSFYLPEKIPLGEYSFTQLTEITGYEWSKDTEFEILEEYDWGAPLIVKIEVYAGRMTLNVLVSDTDSKEPIQGTTVYIYASDDISTADGTVHYNAGDIVETLTTDSTGRCESGELYWGNYRIEVSCEGTVYADPEEQPVVTLKSGADSSAEISCKKTSYAIRLTDELTGNAISDAEFIFEDLSSGTKETLTSDKNGEISVTDLTRGRTYTIIQQTSQQSYSFDSQPVTFTVDETGRIDGMISSETVLTNRLIRVQLGASSYFSGTGVSGVPLTLYDSDGNEIITWESTTAATEYTDLKPGHYVLHAGNGISEDLEFDVEDTCEIQTYRIHMITRQTIMIAVFAVLFLAIIIWLLILLIMNLIRRRREQNNGDDN